MAGDVARALGAIDARADVVALNPPRKGCDAAVLAEVVRLAPRAIAYLSCNPDTLARDLAVLAAHGYHARTVTPFDMLPHTPHVEALAVLDQELAARATRSAGRPLDADVFGSHRQRASGYREAVIGWLTGLIGCAAAMCLCAPATSR